MSKRKPVEETIKSAKQSARRASIFDGHDGAPPAADYIRRVEAVPTCFPHLDYKTGVGGFPVGKLVVVHGPSTEGKTKLTLGLLRSFVEAGHYAAIVDAERTTPPEFARSIMGPAFDDRERFRSIPVRTYDMVRVDVRVFFQTVADARARGDVPPETRALVVVDSLKNLQTENVFEELKKVSASKKGRKPGVDGFGGRAGQQQAAYNTAWFIELGALLHDTLGSIAIIVREEVSDGEGFWDEDKIKLIGGREVRFGNHLQLRTTAVPMFVGEKKDKVFVGERHAVGIYKSKVAKRRDVVPMAFFHSSNGARSPEGLDRALDVFHLGLELGAVEQSGSWYSFGGDKLGQGEDKAAERLREDPLFCNAVETECRKRFGLAGV